MKLYGQHSPFDPGMTAEAARILEKVECCSDRSLYICGESVRFRAVIKGNAPAETGPWSTVLYVELVSPAGERFAQGKYRIRNQVATGDIRIPDRLLSGSYYLRSYTRWMRNRGPETFCYIPLRIVNPRRPEVLEEVQEQGAAVPVPHSDRMQVIGEFGAHPVSYGREEQIHLEMLFKGEHLADTLYGCITAVPRSAGPADWFKPDRKPERDSSGDFRLRFLPDRYGPSLSGSVHYSEHKGEILPRTRVHFTLMGKVPGYFVVRSDPGGRFIVGLPALTGELEFFVQPEPAGSGPVEVRIDQDFDSRTIRLPALPFSLSGEEMQVATILSRNVQLAGIYHEPGSSAVHDTLEAAFPFYGTPTRSLDLDQYVLLPTLKEVFLNLVPSVTPVTRKGETTLRIFSVNPSFSLFAPLVMIDEVPVLDMERFMSVSPAKIRYVDVIEDVYVKGDLRFGGIVNLRSREGNMAGIDLPPHSFFFDYLAIHQPEPERQGTDSPDNRMPDTRNTLFWVPDFRVETGIPARVSFRTPDYPGEYVVLFRGQDAEGTPFTAETTFQVR
jgi:hypothetical protein